MMGMLPSPSQVAKSHIALYEAFYRQVDPAETDCVSAVEAAAFLKRSGLPDSILSKIWDMSDPQSKGFLDKQGFFVALKLIALQQNGKEITLTNMTLDVPPPQMKTLSGRNSPAVDWNIKASEKKKYEEMFYSMGPVGGKLPGDKVKPVMLNSKLPLDVLGKIWDLSDTDQDGYLSKEEFILAMHLVYKALENIPVPSVLPPELISILKRKHSIAGMVPVLPDVLPQGIDNTVSARIRRSSTPSDIIGRGPTWIVNAVDKAKYDDMFHTLDTDKDGFVSGADIKDTLLKSCLPQSALAHIWNLCDIKQNGKLNSEQFALAMYLVQQKIQGIEVPVTLFPEMIPPTLRPKPAPDAISQDATLPIGPEVESSGSKELDMISNEIKELQMEKITLEKDLAQKEADVKIKSGELKNLQNEQDALETMLKQLEIQKGEARKRLSDLDKQKSSLDLNLCDLLAQTEDEVNQIDAMKKQKEDQELELEVQEQELNKKRKEFTELRQEESNLETQISAGKSQLDALTSSLQTTILQISQMKIKIDQLQEQHRLMTDAIKEMDNAISFGDFRNVSDFTLNGFPPIEEGDVTNFSPTVSKTIIEENDASPVEPVVDFQEDPFKSKDPFEGKVNGFDSDPFAGEDPFKTDPFKDTAATSDPFGGDPFGSAFGVTAAHTNSKEDPFVGSDPFDSFGAVVPSTDKDPFDPFGLSKSNTVQSPVTGFDSDPFGADPFGGSSAPPRPESPTPALPPKKSKAPPPRPAPPKVGSSNGPPKPGPTRAAPAPPVPPSAPPSADPFKVADLENTSNSINAFPDLFPSKSSKTQDAFDPFSNPTSASDNFANFDNFADFDNVK